MSTCSAHDTPPVQGPSVHTPSMHTFSMHTTATSRISSRAHVRRAQVTAPRRQRGEMLLEALVGVLITSLIAAGLAHVQARLMTSQRATKVERLVVGQLREQLQTSGVNLCTSGTVALELTSDLTRNATITCGDVEQISVAIGGATVVVDAPRQVDMSVAAADLELEDDSPGEGAVDLLLSSHQ